jgi:WhiB family transcriptional regulator, redox-sensing transcriptional regulator
MSVNVSWMERAKCLDYEPEMWFPRGTGNGARQEAARAVTICESCPVIKDCTEYGRTAAKGYGVWGGKLRSKRPPRNRCKPISHGTLGGYKAHSRRGVPVCEPCRKAHQLYRNEHAAKKRSA